MTTGDSRSKKQPPPEPATAPSLLLLRKCACGNQMTGGEECAECSKSRQPLQRSPRNANDRKGVPPIVHEVLNTPGQPLETNTRTFFEERLGHDFSQVRVHTDGRAGESAAAVDALTYTVGRDVVFGAGQYAPGTTKGDELLAHELTHVVQQPAVSGSPDGLTIGDPHSAFEHEAEHTATTFAGGPVRTQASVDQAQLQRVGIGEGIARLFGGGTFSDQELEQYLRLLDTTGRIEDNYDSDNKAREIVTRWQRGDARYILPMRRKILLIKEMISGFTGDADEEAILTLLRGATDAEFPQIISAVGLAELQDNIHGAERRQLDALVQQRRGGTHAADANRPEVFSEETAQQAQQLFTSNAELAHNVRQNCIEIVRTMAPQILTQDPRVSQQIQSTLGALRGRTLTMPDAGAALTRLGVATGPTQIRFNNDNGNAEPTAMLSSAWDAIIGMVGQTQGWHIFGLAVFNGYHSVTVFVDNRPDGPRVYWADQWAIGPGENFLQEPGSVSGFRRYEQSGFDGFIEQQTNRWWNDVHRSDSRCGRANPRTWDRSCRYTATLKIWHFRHN